MPQAQTHASHAAAEAQIATFIEKFEPGAAKLIRHCRRELRKLLPSANELVWDNYNFFVIGYCASEKPSSCIVSLAAAANGVGLSFYNGASLEDPEHLLQGEGKQNRFVRLPTAATLHEPGVATLIQAAIAQAKVPLAAKGGGGVFIRSVSAKQRPRRKA
jgi:hypothetical protein